MAWQARLQLDYSMERDRCVARHLHSGPLRVLQSLYPEGDAICHNVLVHPPGGLVGGDTLDIEVTADSSSHGLITTPGATRFYRSDGEPAWQKTRLKVGSDARLEWLPLEALCYSGCKAHNQLQLHLAPGAELLGWDVTALGLPNAELPFAAGYLEQTLEIPGVWLERGRIDASDARLLQSPTGLAGNSGMATMFFATGNAIDRNRKQALLDSAREAIAGHCLVTTAGATSPNPRVIVVRVLSDRVEPAMQLLREIRKRWREMAWKLPATDPRIWSM
ncbi:MAG: urease accessory protein UreD [Rhodoferax sp.]